MPSPCYKGRVQLRENVDFLLNIVNLVLRILQVNNLDSYGLFCPAVESKSSEASAVRVRPIGIVAKEKDGLVIYIFNTAESVPLCLSLKGLSLSNEARPAMY